MDEPHVYQEGEVVRIDGDGTEWEVTQAAPYKTHVDSQILTLMPKFVLDEEDESRVKAPEQLEDQSDGGEATDV